MMSSSRFTFVPLPQKVSEILNSKEYQEDLLKWGLKGQIKLKFFNFNQDFKMCDKKDFVECFFRDPSVLNILGPSQENVEFVTVPCSEISMAFFDKLKKEENQIVRAGYLTECLPEFSHHIMLPDNLRQMLLLEDHPSFDLYSNAEKQQFLFQLFKHFCLGGACCQRSDTLKPYLDLTRSLYKELISVEKSASLQSLQVRSVVLKIVANSNGNGTVVSNDSDHPQNFQYLIIDPFKRQVAALYHRFGAYVIV